MVTFWTYAGESGTTLKRNDFFFSKNVHSYRPSLFKVAAFTVSKNSINRQNGQEGLLSIILAGRGILVKKLIIIEPHHIF